MLREACESTVTLPVYLSVDLDYFAEMNSNDRWNGLLSLANQMHGTIENVTIMRDHLPLSIPRWAPRTLKSRNAIIVNLDEHDDAATGELGIGSWMSRYCAAGLRCLWVTPPGSDGVRCDRPPGRLLVQHMADGCLVPDTLGEIVEAAFFVSPGYMRDRGQARDAVLDLLFCLERHEIKANKKRVDAWTLAEIIELVR